MILAGDIGGTKVNLAFFTAGAQGVTPGATATYPSREHASLEEIVRRFLSTHKLRVERACFGVAGPVKQGRAKLTNLPWTVDAQAIADAFDLKQVSLLNDLEATAHGIAGLSAPDFLVLNQGAPVADGNQAIIAAGTGLGEAGLVWDGARQIAVASEGGNADFAPRTDLDIELLRYLRPQFGQVIWEHVLSGPGMFNIYRFLRDTKRAEEPAWLAEEVRANEANAPVFITRTALEKKSALCEQTLDLFTTYYGSESANLALKFLATGGVFIGGGIAPKIINMLKDNAFMSGFIGAHRYRALLEAIPVRVILNDKTALIGAARVAARQITPQR